MCAYHFVKFSLFSETLELFSPYLMDEERIADTPLLVHKKILLFQSMENAIDFLENNYSDIICRTDSIYEFDTTSYVESLKKRYHHGNIIDHLNIMFDYLDAIEIEYYPFFSKEFIYDFADYATFQKNLDHFFMINPLADSKLIDFIYWFIGHIYCNSTLTPS